MLNRCEFMGRLTKDVEITSTSTGKRRGRFNIAVDRGKDKNGRDLGTDFVPCTAWEILGDNIAKYFHKGDGIYIAGRLQVDKLEEKTYYNVIVEKFEFMLQPPKQETTQNALKLDADEDLPF